VKNVENGVFTYIMGFVKGQDANPTVFSNIGGNSGDERWCPLDFLCTEVPLIAGIFVLVKILKNVVMYFIVLSLSPYTLSAIF